MASSSQRRDELDEIPFDYEGHSGRSNFQTTPQAVEIEIDSILRDSTLQVRSRMDDDLVSRYAKAMEHSVKFPPITLGRVDNSIVILDGWHRIEAAQSLGIDTVMAVIKSMSHREAMKFVATANLSHGKALTRKEKRTAFKLFIKGRGHLRTNGRPHSYRYIAEALGGIAGHTTIRGWMRQDFPRIYRAMGADEPFGYEDAGPPRVDVESNRKRQAELSFKEGLTVFKALKPESRYECYELTQKIMAEMSTFEMIQPEEEEF